MQPARQIAAVLTLTASVAYGQLPAKSTTAKAWTKEPEAVFGVRLGRPLSDSKIIGCQELEADRSRDTQPCLQPRGKYNHDEIMGLRYTGINIAPEATIYMEGGVVRSVNLSFSTDEYLKMLRIVSERFGAPASIKAGEATTKIGATFSATTARWEGKANSIVLYERLGTVDSGSLIFSNNQATKNWLDKDAKGRSEAAAKF